jgi:apolipoprotein N-acyltransferase
MTLFPPQAATVRVASLTRADIDLFPSPEVQQRAMTDTLTAEDIEEIRGRGNSINEDLLERARRETQAGAKIVLWGETNAFVMKADEPSFIRRCAELAREEGVYLGAALAVWDRASPKPLENKLVLIDPRGDVAWESLKAIPIPGPEAAMSAIDDGRIKSADTPHGRIGGVICFDMDFPELLKQAGDLQTDIMLVPSNDWRGIDPWHSHMARLRAIEQGFNMVRHTSGGLSVAVDYQGRVLSSMDHYTAVNRVLVSNVPTQGVGTIYSRVGDVFAWLCIAALALAIVVTVLPSARRIASPDDVRPIRMAT